MAQIVIHELEVVEVHGHNGKRMAVPLMTLHCAVETLFEQCAIGQTGQRIAQRLVRECGHQPPVLAHCEELAGWNGDHQEASRDHDRPRVELRHGLGGRDYRRQQ